MHAWAARPDRPLEETLVLELDVAAFTSGPGVQDEVPLAHQGKFLGVLDRHAAAPCSALMPAASMRAWRLQWQSQTHACEVGP
jgi:hypothetical protein